MNLFEVSLLLPRAPAETTPLSFLTALLFEWENLWSTQFCVAAFGLTEEYSETPSWIFLRSYRGLPSHSLSVVFRPCLSVRALDLILGQNPFLNLSTVFSLVRLQIVQTFASWLLYNGSSFHLLIFYHIWQKNRAALAALWWKASLAKSPSSLGRLPTFHTPDGVGVSKPSAPSWRGYPFLWFPVTFASPCETPQGFY